MTREATVIPIHGTNKNDTVEELLEAIQESPDYNIIYMISGEESGIVFGHTAKLKSDLITMTYDLQKLVDYFIEVNDLSHVLVKDVIEEVEDENPES